MKKYECSCCGYYTLRYDEDICGVCSWHEDNVCRRYPDEVTGPNMVSLNQAHENYKEFGASDKRFIDKVRKPLLEELPENNR